MKNRWFDDEQHEETPTGPGPQLLALAFTIGGILLAALLLFTPDMRALADWLADHTFMPRHGGVRGIGLLVGQAVLIGAILGLPMGLAGLAAGVLLRRHLTDSLWPQVPLEMMGLMWAGGGSGFAIVVWWTVGRWGG